jgi:SPP1 gp7 family putative phage head morphogenesis protein
MLTRDRKRRGNPVKTRAAEQRYGRGLKKIAEHCGTIVNGFPPGDTGSAATITQMLEAYANMLDAWAVQTASNMLMDVALRDERTWKEYAKDLSRGLREEIRKAPTGQVMQQLLAEQVHLIKSIPREAAERVHRLTVEGLMDSTRASEIAKEIQRTGEVAKSRANLIARTEVSRTASTLTQARAQYIGSDGYIWRTSGDGDVRHSHREMEGKFVRWDDPPTLDGMKGHAGCFPNCRCYPEPVIPED